MVRRSLLSLLFCLTAWQVGCTPDTGPQPPRISRADEPVGMQIQRLDPALRGLSFRILLDFESAADLTFVTTDGKSRAPTTSPSLAHTGRAALAAPEGTRQITVKLASLLSTNGFPDHWTLVGAYLHSDTAQQVTIAYTPPGGAALERTVVLPANHWTAVLLDVSGLADPNLPQPPIGDLSFRFANLQGAEALWMDDVIVVDNQCTLSDAASNAAVGPASSASRPSTIGATDSPEALSVKVRGFRLIIDRPGVLHLELPTADAQTDGWSVLEAGPLRVRLHREQGPTKSWTLYNDGRAYVDGKLDPAVKLPAGLVEQLTAQQQNPAEMEIPAELGRTDRGTPGDDNNDAYNERFGSYELLAHGAMMKVTLTPRTLALALPVLEIAGLPPGKVVGTIEGELLNNIVRLQNGHVLIQIPGTLTRPTTVNVRVQ